MTSLHYSDGFDSEYFKDAHNASQEFEGKYKKTSLTLCRGHFAQGADFLSLHANFGEKSIFQGLLGFILALQHCKQLTLGELYQAFDSDSDGYVSLDDFVASFSSLGFSILEGGDMDLVVALFRFLDPSRFGYITHDSWFTELGKEKMLFIPCAEYGDEIMDIEETAEDRVSQFESHSDLHIAFDENRFDNEREYFTDFHPNPYARSQSKPNLYAHSHADSGFHVGKFRGTLQEHIDNGKFRKDVLGMLGSEQLHTNGERLRFNLESIVENDEIESERAAFEDSAETMTTCFREPSPRFLGRVSYRDAPPQLSEVNENDEVYHARVTRVCEDASRLTDFADATTCGTFSQDSKDAEVDRMWIIAPVDHQVHRRSDPHRSFSREAGVSDGDEQVALENSPAAAKQGPKWRKEHVTRMSLVATTWLADSASQTPTDDNLQHARGECTEHDQADPHCQDAGCSPTETVESFLGTSESFENRFDPAEPDRLINGSLPESVSKSKQNIEQLIQSPTSTPSQLNEDQISLDGGCQLSRDIATIEIEESIGSRDNDFNETGSGCAIQAAHKDSEENPGPNDMQSPIFSSEGSEHKAQNTSTITALHQGPLGEPNSSPRRDGSGPPSTQGPISSAPQAKVELVILVKVIAPTDCESPVEHTDGIANNKNPRAATVVLTCTPCPENEQANDHTAKELADKSLVSLDNGPELVGCNLTVEEGVFEDCLRNCESLASRRKDGDGGGSPLVEGTGDSSDSSMLSFEMPSLVLCAQSLQLASAKVPEEQMLPEFNKDVGIQSAVAVSLQGRLRSSDTLLDQMGQDPESDLSRFPDHSAASERRVLDEPVEILPCAQSIPSAELPEVTDSEPGNSNMLLHAALSSPREGSLLNNIAQYIQRSLSHRILNTEQQNADAESCGFESVEGSYPSNVILSPTIQVDAATKCYSATQQDARIRYTNEHCYLETQSNTSTRSVPSPDSRTKQQVSFDSTWAENYGLITNVVDNGMPLILNQATSMKDMKMSSSTDELQNLNIISSSTEESQSVSALSSNETFRPGIMDSGSDLDHCLETSIEKQASFSASLRQDYRNITIGETQTGLTRVEVPSLASSLPFGIVRRISADVSPVLPLEDNDAVSNGNAQALPDGYASSRFSREAHTIDCPRHLLLSPIEADTSNFQDENHAMLQSGVTNAPKCNLSTNLRSQPACDVKLQKDQTLLDAALGTNGWSIGRTSSSPVKNRRRQYLCPLPPISTKTAAAGEECQAAAQEMLATQSPVYNVPWNQSYDYLAYGPKFDSKDAWKAEIRRRQQLITHEAEDMPGQSSPPLNEIMSKLKLDLSKLEKPKDERKKNKKERNGQPLKEKPMRFLDVQPKGRTAKQSKLSLFISVGRVEYVKAHEGPQRSACEFQNHISSFESGKFHNFVM